MFYNVLAGCNLLVSWKLNLLIFCFYYLLLIKCSFVIVASNFKIFIIMYKISQIKQTQLQYNTHRIIFGRLGSFLHCTSFIFYLSLPIASQFL